MKQIYGISTCIIWLGAEADNSNEATNLLAELRYCDDLFPDTYLDKEFEGRLLALANFFQRPWWKRVWVI
jgi:hypothetical protein